MGAAFVLYISLTIPTFAKNEGTQEAKIHAT